jgi:26S proteasome regulatory subunit N10
MTNFLWHPLQESNTAPLTTFINTVNGKDGTSSHLVTVPHGPILADALISSTIIAGEEGGAPASGDALFDPANDPELELVSIIIPTFHYS